jgi:hypothetical protein
MSEDFYDDEYLEKIIEKLIEKLTLGEDIEETRDELLSNYDEKTVRLMYEAANSLFEQDREKYEQKYLGNDVFETIEKMEKRKPILTKENIIGFVAIIFILLQIYKHFFKEMPKF